MKEVGSWKLEWAPLDTTTKFELVRARSAAFMRQNWVQERLLPDESGVLVAVSRCAQLEGWDEQIIYLHF